MGLEVDLASTAPRPDNPAANDQMLRLFDPISGRVEVEAAPALLARLLPVRTVWLRVYSDRAEARAAIREAAVRTCPECAGVSADRSLAADWLRRAGEALAAL